MFFEVRWEGRGGGWGGGGGGGGGIAQMAPICSLVLGGTLLCLSEVQVTSKYAGAHSSRSTTVSSW